MNSTCIDITTMHIKAMQLYDSVLWLNIVRCEGIAICVGIIYVARYMHTQNVAKCIAELYSYIHNY